MKSIVWFDEIGKNDVPLVGGKGANLGEMTKAGIPVPPGFIVTADSYFYFLKKLNLGDKIRQYLEPLDPDETQKLQEASSKIKEVILRSKVPQEIAEGIKQAYRKMGGGLVAVRSSATAEDLPEASFAGQQRTFLNVQGEEEVVAAVKGCWASLFEARAIFYRVQQGFDHFKVGIAVPVQKMVQSEAAGVMFTLEPVSNDQSKIAIEAIYGLGEAIVSGETTPDLYMVDKSNLAVVEKKITRQEWQLVRNLEDNQNLEEANIKVSIAEADQAKQKLTDEEILTLAKLGQVIEDLYQFPQDIEWAREQGEIYIVQTRPVTTIKPPKGRLKLEEFEGITPLLSGTPASPGIAAGSVRVLHGSSEISQIEKGEVLVAEMTTPDYVPAMKKAVAIATDKGGRTCHAAIVSRELGIPCVVGTGNATQLLKIGQLVTVDGFQGRVLDGRVIPEKVYTPTAARGAHLKTKTKLYVNLAEPDLAEAVAARNVDGVGLLRAEFMIAQIGEHPNYMLREGRGKQFVEKLTQGLTSFAKAFNPRPVVYRTTDFKTNEYRHLKGGQEFEEEEENPMIGYRGCSRYIRDLDAFKLEIEAIKKVRQKYKNLWVMIPFVRTVDEIAQAKRILAAEGLVQSRDFKLWMMVEVPSNILILDKFLDVGIDGISIGSNDLTQLILGIDRDSAKLAEQFDERNEAVLVALEKAIKTSVSRGVTASICGQAPSVYPELTKKLVEWGITSVSVSPDAIEHTREIIADVEEEQKTGGKGHNDS